MNTFSDPRKVVDQLNFLPGEHIADLGAGTGAYTMAIAEKCKSNPESKIFAIDIQKELISRIAREAEEQSLSSVHIIWGDIESEKGTRLRKDSIDTVLIANTLFQLDSAASAIKEAVRVLKPGGRLIIIDWAESFGNIGPKTDDIIAIETAKLLCREAGLEFSHSFDAGEHHYGFIVSKK